MERTEVVEHHTIAVKQGLGDEGFDTCQHSQDVTLGAGGGEGPCSSRHRDFGGCGIGFRLKVIGYWV